jgi:hypothetical protein
MVYNIQNYRDSGLCASPGIVNTRKHDVSETGSVSVVRNNARKEHGEVNKGIRTGPERYQVLKQDRAVCQKT